MMDKHDIVRFGQTTLIALCVKETVRRTDCFHTEQPPNERTGSWTAKEKGRKRGQLVQTAVATEVEIGMARYGADPGR
jgi:hypothetical protein